jgi:hypothetical protein
MTTATDWGSDLVHVGCGGLVRQRERDLGTGAVCERCRNEWLQRPGEAWKRLPTTEEIAGSDPDFTHGLPLDQHMNRMRGGEIDDTDWQWLAANGSRPREVLARFVAACQGKGWGPEQALKLLERKSAK